MCRAGRIREHSPAGDGRDGTPGEKLCFGHYRVAGEQQGFDDVPLGTHPIRTRTMSIEECDQRAFIPRCRNPSALTSTPAPSARPDDAQERGNSRDQAAAVLQPQAEKGAARALKRAARQGGQEGRASRRSRPSTPASGREAFAGAHATPGTEGWQEAAGAGRAAELVFIMRSGSLQRSTSSDCTVRNRTSRNGMPSYLTLRGTAQPRLACLSVWPHATGSQQTRPTIEECRASSRRDFFELL